VSQAACCRCTAWHSLAQVAAEDQQPCAATTAGVTPVRCSNSPVYASMAFFIPSCMRGGGGHRAVCCLAGCSQALEKPLNAPRKPRCHDVTGARTDVQPTVARERCRKSLKRSQTPTGLEAETLDKLVLLRTMVLARTPAQQTGGEMGTVTKLQPPLPPNDTDCRARLVTSNETHNILNSGAVRPGLQAELAPSGGSSSCSAMHSESLAVTVRLGNSHWIQPEVPACQCLPTGDSRKESYTKIYLVCCCSAPNMGDHQPFWWCGP
jgi:hypothetical protein